MDIETIGAAMALTGGAASAANAAALAANAAALAANAAANGANAAANGALAYASEYGALDAGTRLIVSLFQARLRDYETRITALEAQVAALSGH